mgnify:FL=1
MSDLMPESVYRQHLEAGNDWADKYGAYRLLDDITKSILAQESISAKRSEGCSMAEAESIARSTSVYTDHLKSVSEAHTAANRAKVRYDAIKVLWEARRSQEASERAANRMQA